MIKKIIFILMLAAALFVMTGCGNRAIIDTAFTFRHAAIYTPGGEIYTEGKVDNWKDFEDGDQIQVTINGNTYLTHSSLVIMSTK